MVRLNQQVMSSCSIDHSRLLPLSVIITPATLSVRSIISPATVDLAVTTLNITNFAGLREGCAVHASLTRLSKLVTSGVRIPPVDVFVANSSYILEITGPSLRCDTPSSDVIDIIDAIFEKTGGSLVNRNNNKQEMAVYIAFTPFTPWRLSDYAWPLDDLGKTSTNSSDWGRFVTQCLKGSQPYCSLLGPTLYGTPNDSVAYSTKTLDTTNALWLRFGDERMYCSVQKTRYRLRFDARNPLTSLKSYSYTQDGAFEADSPEHEGLIVAVQPLLDILRGSTYINTKLCYLAGMQENKCSTDLDYVTSQTSIHETALSALVYQKAGEIRNKTWDVAKYQKVLPPSNDSIPSPDPIDFALARNLSLREIIEEMSRNLTLGYFSDARYLSPNSTKVDVITTVPVNVYHYNIRNLVLVYAIAFGASLVAVVMGLHTFAANGYLNRTANFSAILCATIRNPGLGELIERSTTTADSRQHSSSMNPGPNVLKMGLKYGTLLDNHILDTERRETGDLDSTKVEAFGVSGQVL
jgi:hypothetical protein